MQRQKQARTTPELALLKALRALGLRPATQVRIEGLRRRADFVFAKQRVVVFVDGCFWHACPRHATWPKANATWWREKLLGNKARDRNTNLHLRRSGWRVVRIWEHERAGRAALMISAKLQSEH